jgi:hypothetical protein
VLQWSASAFSSPMRRSSLWAASGAEAEPTRGDSGSGKDASARIVNARKDSARTSTSNCQPSLSGRTMRHLVIATLFVAISAPVRAEVSPEASEFLQLPGERQSAYVKGVLEGMSYVMLNYDKAGYEKWEACVRAQSLEAMLIDVRHLLEENPDSKNALPWAITRTVNTRC